MSAATEALGLDLDLAQPVEFTWTLTRRGLWRDRREEKLWVTEQWPGQSEPAPRRGIVVGIRTLADGVNQGGYSDEPTVFRATRYFRAYLVAFDLRRKPVLVLPQHVRTL